MDLVVLNARAHYVSKVAVDSEYDKQHAAAVIYCDKFKCKAQRGIRLAREEHPECWPEVTLQSLRCAIRNKAAGDFPEDIQVHRSYDKRSLLTPLEREDLAAGMYAAAERASGYSKDDRNEMVLDILRWRDARNKKGGRNFQRLSNAAKVALDDNHVGRSFWRKFYIDFPVLDRKNVVETALNRAKNCSRLTGLAHIEAIIKALFELGIYDKVTGCMKPGMEGNLIWLDECCNFFSYDLLRGSNRLVTCIKGKPAKHAVQQNRNTFSIDAAMGSDGYMYHPHVLFAGDSMTSDCVPDCVRKLEFMMITNNACGVQTGTTFIERLKNLENEARARGVKGPILFATDGHGSRFFYPLVKYMAEKDADGVQLRDMYLTPPNSTGTLCWLDQVFSHLHREYAKRVCLLKKSQGLAFRINKYEAVSAVVDMWSTWASPASISHAQKICGFHEGKWSIDTIPTENFLAGDKMNADAAEFAHAATTPIANPNWLAITCPSPADGALATVELPKDGLPTPDVNIVRNTPEYFIEKIRLLGLVIEHQRDDTVVSPIERGLIQTKWYEKPKNKTFKITNVWGSFLAKDLLLTMKDIQDAEEEEERKRAAKKDDLWVLYDLCKGGCRCEGSVCLASGIYVCFTCEPVHGNIRRGFCQKAICKKARLVSPPLVPPLPKKAKVRRTRAVGGPSASQRPGRKKAVVEEPESETEEESEENSEYGESKSAESDDDGVDSELDESGVARTDVTYRYVVGGRYKVFWQAGSRGDLPAAWLTCTCLAKKHKNGVWMEYDDDGTSCLHDHRTDWQIVPLGNYGDRGNTEESIDDDIPLKSRTRGAK